MARGLPFRWPKAPDYFSNVALRTRHNLRHPQIPELQIGLRPAVQLQKDMALGANVALGVVGVVEHAAAVEIGPLDAVHPGGDARAFAADLERVPVPGVQVQPAGTGCGAMSQFLSEG